jgi:hypothetical protein
MPINEIALEQHLKSINQRVVPDGDLCRASMVLDGDHECSDKQVKTSHCP